MILHNEKLIVPFGQVYNLCVDCDNTNRYFIRQSTALTTAFTVCNFFDNFYHV